MDVVYVCAPADVPRARLLSICTQIAEAGRAPFAWQLALTDIATGDTLRLLLKAYVAHCNVVYLSRGSNPWADPSVRIALQAASENGLRLEYEP